jgi:hypothetical protein
MLLDGRLCEALRYRPRPLPFPRLLGPHSLIAGALWVFPSPSGCSAGLAVPPSERLENLHGLGLGLA